MYLRKYYSIMTRFYILLISGIGAPCKDQPDPQADTGAVHLHPTHTRNNHGRSVTLRLHLHPIILHPELDMVVADVLHVRVSVSCVYNSRDNLRRDHNTLVLLPSVRRRLPLVVEVVPDVWFYGCLSVLVLLPLLLHEAAS